MSFLAFSRAECVFWKIYFLRLLSLWWKRKMDHLTNTCHLIEQPFSYSSSSLFSKNRSIIYLLIQTWSSTSPENDGEAEQERHLLFYVTLPTTSIWQNISGNATHRSGRIRERAVATFAPDEPVHVDCPLLLQTGKRKLWGVPDWPAFESPDLCLWRWCTEQTNEKKKWAKEQTRKIKIKKSIKEKKKGKQGYSKGRWAFFFSLCFVYSLVLL